MASLSISSTTTTITVIVTGLTAGYNYRRDFKWYLNSVFYGTTQTEPNVTETSYSFYSLTPGTEYNFIVDIYGYDPGSAGGWMASLSALPATLPMQQFYDIGNPYVSVAYRSNDILTVCMNNMNSGALNQRTIDWYRNNVYVGQTVISDTTATYSPWYFFVNLSSNMTYLIRGDITYNNGTTWVSKSVSVNIPTTFLWSNYGNAPTNSQSTYYIPKAVAWNALISNINAVRQYKGLQNYPFTHAYGISNQNEWQQNGIISSTIITANIYNEAYVAIRQIDNGAWGTYLRYMYSKSSPLYDYDWCLLQTELNAII